MEQQQDYKCIKGPLCEPSNEEAVYWQLPVHHCSYPRQTRQLHAETIRGSAQPTSSHTYTLIKPMNANAPQPISNASFSTDPAVLSTSLTQQTTSQQQHLRWQRYGQPWGNTNSAEPKGGGPVKQFDNSTGYGSSWGKSWHSYVSDRTQTCNQGWEWTSSAEKSSEANYSAGRRATAVEPWNLAQAQARASHGKQMKESQTCTKADAKGTSVKRQVVRWPGNPDCCDESSSAEETVVQMDFQWDFQMDRTIEIPMFILHLACNRAIVTPTLNWRTAFQT